MIYNLHNLKFTFGISFWHLIFLETSSKSIYKQFHHHNKLLCASLWSSPPPLPAPGNSIFLYPYSSWFSQNQITEYAAFGNGFWNSQREVYPCCCMCLYSILHYFWTVCPVQMCQTLSIHLTVGGYLHCLQFSDIGMKLL